MHPVIVPRLGSVRCVRTLVRSLLVLVFLARAVSADVGAGLVAQATRYDDRPNRNIGAAVELSLDRARWQYLAELAIAGASFGPDFADGVAGTMYRGGVGVRHIARRFSVQDRLDFELGFEALVALQDIEWSSGERDVRPELDAGFSWNFVFFRKIAYRTSIRAFFTPSPSSTIACRGSCPKRDEITSGYMIVTGLVW